MRTLHGFVDVNSDMQIASPQVTADIDRDRATSLGVTPEQIQYALYGAYGNRQVSTSYAPANQYSVILEVEPEYQRNPEALSKLYLRSSTGQAGAARHGGGPHAHGGSAADQPLRPAPGGDHRRSICGRVSRLATPAQSVDEAIRELRMPASISANFQGTVKEFQHSFQNLSILLIVAILVIYIVLGILYESFIHPITILSGLPSAVFGALLTLMIFHKELDLYAFVGHHHAVRRGEEERIMMIDFAIEAQQRTAECPRRHLARAACCASARS